VITWYMGLKMLHHLYSNTTDLNNIQTVDTPPSFFNKTQAHKLLLSSIPKIQFFNKFSDKTWSRLYDTASQPNTTFFFRFPTVWSKHAEDVKLSDVDGRDYRFCIQGTQTNAFARIQEELVHTILLLPKLKCGWRPYRTGGFKTPYSHNISHTKKADVQDV
jgi:hypothetical protein